MSGGPRRRRTVKARASVQKEVLAAEAAQPTPGNGRATIEQGDDIELTDADRAFLDYLAAGAVRRYFARPRKQG